MVHSTNFSPGVAVGAQFAKFAVAGALLNGILVGLLSGAGLHFLLAQVVATAAILVLNFIVSKLWIFQ